MPGSSHDVFISHASVDKGIVERLCRDLLQAGVRPWFDKWDLPVGKPWQDGLEAGLMACPVVIVCLGEGGMRPWHTIEMQTALMTAVGDPSRRVVPVWLPGASMSSTPTFLKLDHGVDLGTDWAAGVRQLANAILGRPSPRPVLAETACPYPGLRAFEERDAMRMYGREADVQTLLERLRRSRLLPLVGASGSGKSSLVRAGLVPAVRTGELDGQFDWRIAIMQPRSRPLTELAKAVLRLAGKDHPRLAIPSGVGPTEELTKRAAQPAFLASSMDMLADETQREPGVLLVVDQFEELFNAAPPGGGVRASESDSTGVLANPISDAERFVHNILHAVDNPEGRIHVVLTLRADFLHRCLEWSDPGLARAVAETLQVALPALGIQQIEEAIRRPALSVGADVEPAVVDNLVQGVAEHAGQLPLLQHCLVEMWQRRDLESNTLTWQAYQDVGGLHGAIARTADGLLERMDPAERPAVRRVLGRLVQLGQGTGDTRRHAPLSEFATGSVERAALDALVSHHLVTVDQDSAQIVHEALIQNWETLQGWLSEDRGVLQLRQELIAAAAAWRANAEDAGVLWRGARLTRAVEILTERGDVGLTEAERAFLDAGVAVEEAARQEQERGRQERLRLARRASRALGAAVFALVIVVVGVSAFGRAAWRQSQRATRASVAARSQTILANARLASVDGNWTVARLLLAAVPTVDRPMPWINSAYDWLQRPVTERVLRGHAAPLSVAAFSPDGQRVLTASKDGTARIWRTDGRGTPIVLDGHTNEIVTVAFSPDGQRVLTASSDRTARVWNTDGSGVPKVLVGHERSLTFAAYSPDGRRILTASKDGTARVWNTEGSGPSVVLSVGFSGPFLRTAAAFSPDGERLVIACAENAACVWPGDGVGDPIVLRGHRYPVFAAAFSPDGGRVLTVSRDGTARVQRADGTGPSIIVDADAGGFDVAAAFSADGKKIVIAIDEVVRVWSADGSGSPVVLRGHEGLVQTALFSPDGRRILTASMDCTARVWNADGSGSAIVLKGHAFGLTGASFSPDGERIVTASVDHTARVWKVDGYGLPLVLKGHAKRVTAVAFSPDSRSVLTSSWDGTARIWDVEGTRAPVVLKGHAGEVMNAAFSPDGKRVVTASADKTARIYDADGSGSPTVLEGHSDYLVDAVFSPDARRVVTASADHTARVWRTDKGESDPVVLEHDGRVECVSFSPDSKRIVTCSRRAVRVWSADRPEQQLFSLDDVQAPVFSPDGQRIAAVASNLPKAIVFNADGTGQPVRVDVPNTTGAGVVFSPDGERIAAFSFDQTTRIWRADGRGPPTVLTGHTSRVRDAAFSPDGRWLATASWDKTARIWNSDGTGEAIVLHGHSAHVNDVAFSPDGRRIVTGSEDGTARVWPLDEAVIRDYLRARVEPCLPPMARIRYLAEDTIVAEARWRGCESACWGRAFGDNQPIEHVVCPRDGGALQPKPDIGLGP